jgi:hypothetical protein
MRSPCCLCILLNFRKEYYEITSLRVFVNCPIVSRQRDVASCCYYIITSFICVPPIYFVLHAMCVLSKEKGLLVLPKTYCLYFNKIQQ